MFFHCTGTGTAHRLVQSGEFAHRCWLAKACLLAKRVAREVSYFQQHKPRCIHIPGCRQTDVLKNLSTGLASGLEQYCLGGDCHQVNVTMEVLVSLSSATGATGYAPRLTISSHQILIYQYKFSMTGKLKQIWQEKNVLPGRLVKSIRIIKQHILFKSSVWFCFHLS